jgi:uncharacterized protein YceK
MTTKFIFALALMASALGGCSTMDSQGSPGGGSSSYGNNPNAPGSYYPNTGGGN